MPIIVELFEFVLVLFSWIAENFMNKLSYLNDSVLFEFHE